MFLIYGAGKFGRDYVRYLEKKGIDDFIITDSNEKLWGKQINGHSVINPKDVNPKEIEYVLCAVPPKTRQEVKKVIEERYGKVLIREFDFPVIRFDDGELEVSIVTYNRYKFVRQWIEMCYDELEKRNIDISIYDGSPNTETENYISNLKKQGYKIDYHHVSSDIHIGYKPVLPFLATNSKYIWVVGDSRTHDFEEFDRRVFPKIKQGIDYVSMYVVSNSKNDGKIYSDQEIMINDNFSNGTCIGLSIYKTEIFEPIRSNPDFLIECDRKYGDNYGLGWLGYFYECFARKSYQTYFVNINTYTFKGKTEAWLGNFSLSWVENLMGIIDQIPDSYFGTNPMIARNNLLKRVWREIGIDSCDYLYLGRKHNGLNPEIYVKYSKTKQWNRVTEHKGRIMFYAYAPMWLLRLLHKDK